MFKSMFKNRTIGFWLGIAAAVIAIIGSIIFVAIDASDRTFTIAGFLFMLIGGITEVIILLTDFKFGPIIPAVLYILGFAFTVNAALPSLSDVWNNVTFIGGNAYVGVAFSAVFLVCALLGVVMNFMEQRKSAQA